MKTYYVCLNDDGRPATPRQRRLLGTEKYGFPTRLAAEMACPNGAHVAERHSEGGNDWAGRMLSLRLSDGTLQRLA